MKLKKQTKQQRRQKRKQRQAERLAASNVGSFICVDDDASVSLMAAESTEDGKPRIRRFEMVAYNGGRLFVSRFPHPAVVDLSTLKASKTSYPSHLDHKSNQRVGHTTRVAIDQGKITAEGLISAANTHAEEVVNSGDNGFPWQASVGVRFDNSNVSFVRAGAKVSVNGRDFNGPLFVVRNGTLNEISFVSVGGDEDGATARVAASATQPEGDDEMGFAAWLKAKGFDINTLNAEQKEFFQASYDAEMADNESAEESSSSTVTASEGGTATLEAEVAERRTLMATESERERNIRELCAEAEHPTMRINNQTISIEAHAIQSGWDTNRTELEILRQSRGSASVQAHSHGATCNLEAMQGAVMLAGGVPLDNPMFGTMQAQAMGLPEWTARNINDDRRQQIMEAAHRFSEMHSLDICREAVRLDGRMIPSGRTALIQAAFSGSNLLNIWTTNVNARLLMKFRETRDSTIGWCQERDVQDFRLNERIRTEKGGRLDKHARGKSAEHHSGSDTKETYRIARYSKQFFRDEMDVIDDRLMAGQETVNEMAMAAARLRPDLVYAILMGNPVMADNVAIFHANRNNLDDTGATLTATILKEAITRMSLQQENGVNLNLSPTHLITSATLSFTARQILQSAETRAASASGGLTMNEVQNAVANLVSDSRIDNGVLDPDSGTTIAGDATASFLVSTEGPTIEVGYLAGTGRAPSVTTWRKTGEDGEWGVGAAVKMDIGAAAMAFQTMQKMTD